jgi:outer membrane receptor protein involved in Fe transport
VVNRDTAYVLADMRTRVHTTNKAIFGNLNYRPVDKLTLTAGFRYLGETLKWRHQKVTGPNGDHIGAADPSRPGANFGTPAFDVDRSFSDTATIGKLIAKYEFTPDILVFGSWAKGYKGQAVDADIYVTQAGYNNSPVAPERSRSWEAASRARFLDRRAELNVTYYDTLFTGYQTSSAGLDGSGAPVLRSAGKLYTSGVEGEFTLRPLDGLTLSGNFLFADNKFGDLFVDAVTNVKGGTPLNAPEEQVRLRGLLRHGDRRVEGVVQRQLHPHRQDPVQQPGRRQQSQLRLAAAGVRRRQRQRHGARSQRPVPRDRLRQEPGRHPLCRRPAPDLRLGRRGGGGGPVAAARLRPLCRRDLRGEF